MIYTNEQVTRRAGYILFIHRNTDPPDHLVIWGRCARHNGKGVRGVMPYLFGTITEAFDAFMQFSGRHKFQPVFASFINLDNYICECKDSTEC